MENSKRYEILDALPTYGPMYIPVSTNDKPFYSQGFVVKFIKSDGSNWIANFQPGLGEYSGVYPLNNKFAIFANGTCYIMHPDIIKPLKVFGWGFNHVINTPNKQIIAIDLTNIFIIEPNEQLWESERISFDGFKEIQLKDNNLSGLSFEPMNDEWIPFSLNLKTKEISGGSYRQFEFIPIGKNVERVKIKTNKKKVWWKFWE